MFCRLSTRTNYKHLKHLDVDVKAVALLWNLYRWERWDFQFKGQLDEQDVQEMIQLYDSKHPVFEMLHFDDYSTTAFHVYPSPVVDGAFIRRRCCGQYQHNRVEEPIRRLP